MAKPCEYQSYFLNPPIEDGKCDHYWKMDVSPTIPGGNAEIKEI